MKGKIIKLVSCIIFLVLIVKSVSYTTYLFRNANYDRLHIIGMYEEKPLDMVYIGGSSVFVYWQPLKAWNDCGFTSYSYATNGLEVDGYIAYMEEVLERQTPKMFVVEMRGFQNVETVIKEGQLRDGSDSMDLFSLNRWKYVYDYLGDKTFTEDTDIFSFYVDIAKYHTNVGNLAKPEAWEYIDNRAECNNKGWEWIDSWAEVSMPVGFETAELGMIDERTSDKLIELLEFCASKKLEVLFVVSPYAITREVEMKYNTIGNIVDSYGYKFLNTNNFYKEMNLDFSTDFYNENHVNLFGAEKYTRFLENYLTENYKLPEHRADADYASWDEEYERYAKEEIQHKEIVSSFIEKAQKGKEIAVQMQLTDDFLEWSTLAEELYFTVLISEQGQLIKPDNLAESQILGKWGISENKKDAIRVLSGSSVIYSNEDDCLTTYSGEYGSGISGTANRAFAISSAGGISLIEVDGKEYGLGKDGLNVVVVDNNYLDVVDSVNITNQNGKLVLSRG